MNPEEMQALLALEAERQKRENEGPAARAFREADQKMAEALQRVLAARTTDDPRGFGRDLDWVEFREALALLNQYAHDRHAAKHHAVIEARYAPLPTVYRSSERHGKDE